MDHNSFKVLSLCSGVGGLDIGVRLAIPNARTVCYVEIEAYSCEVLATRMEERILDEAPIWTDLKTFDGKPWRGKVDCIIGGYPCQPFSIAGKKGGTEDPRHLFPHIARIIREVRPRYCFFENVENHLNIGFKEVKEELQSMGYEVETGIFSAEEVGATHQRRRIFILAYSKCFGWRGRSEMDAPFQISGCQTAKDQTERSDRKYRVLDAKRIKYMANPNHKRCNYGKIPIPRVYDKSRRSFSFKTQWSRGTSPETFGLSEDNSGALVYSNNERLERRDKSIRSREFTPWAPSPKSNAWNYIDESLRPAISKTEPPILRVADGMGAWMDRPVDANRTDRLRAVGNGVVPVSAGLAFLTLSEREPCF